jgi:hypothetical protein
MRSLKRIAIAMLLSAALPTAVEAACSGAQIISSKNDRSSYIWTQDVFVPLYYGAGYPPMMVFGNPPVTSEFSGVFWALGTGDPAFGLGDDNGDFYSANWFHYDSDPTYGVYYAGYVNTNWGQNGIDGCLLNAGATSGLDGDECTCILLSDQYGTDGYFAIASSMVDINGHTYFDMPGADGNGNGGPIILVPIPKPFITLADTNFATRDIDLTVTIDPFSTGIYEKDGCDCGPVGFKIRSMLIPRGDPPPADRDAELWTELELAGGGAQPVTPLGSSVTVASTCGYAYHDVYLAAQLIFDSGFGTAVVSRNSTRIECGPTLAEPVVPATRPEAARAVRAPGSRRDWPRSGRSPRSR